MCGIAGIYAQDGAVRRDMLSSISSALAHRGPDGEGFYYDDNIGLAHRRLSIIDITDNAAQPMADESSEIILVFNGEIYNYIELKSELKEIGHTFRSESDTEVIIHAYKEWGFECLKRFNGMWAFALYDKVEKLLFCARDRFGIKPFYYSLSGNSFYFASEIKALLKNPEIGTTPDDEKLLLYLSCGITDNDERTLFEGICSLKPAHYMTVRGGKPENPVCYWDLSVSKELFSAGNITDDKSAYGLYELLRDSVRLRLRSDVPVGTCLSGGLDSSTITAIINVLIREENPLSVGDRQKTFTSCYEDERYDERVFVDEIIEKTGASGYRIFPDVHNLRDDIYSLITTQEEPFDSLSIYSQYCVMKLAGESVKVVLDGQGADEQLAGYLGYQASHIRSLSLSPAALLREIAGIMKHHRRFFIDAAAKLKSGKKRRSYLFGVVPFTDRYAGTLDEVLYNEMSGNNLQALLRYEDRNSMAFSIESRVPFLDYRLVEYIASLPLDQKIRGGVTKYCLRKAAKGLIPESVRCRMDKMGFVAPDEVWFGEDISDIVGNVFNSDEFASRKYWDANEILKDYNLFLSGKTGYSKDFWRVFCSELWLRIFFDGRSELL
ncbi:asparagine synthase (glutamine-hydrolyzing) [Methanoplanus endosymbiosus]|uniref:Putative asparagine synthetase [glutamine-hydrolyzing] n=1 Tax=Methanoplanus endosymbiosus TaxID=33865 RepID=A0A9E7PLQ6_9EURY|nr:asparagine synthase (glutamine-hydrolyzing) [Methanoplanus endosymbiosus]UUX91284.1 asparagine synthase (glutamine-hydrolyzing) [Methanoplanus endosymbiosus]